MNWKQSIGSRSQSAIPLEAFEVSMVSLADAEARRVPFFANGIHGYVVALDTETY